MRDRGFGRARQRLFRGCGLALLGLLAGTGLHGGSSDSAERTGPVKIGALTQSWGPTPVMVGLRDGLLALGYREGEQLHRDYALRGLTVLAVNFREEPGTVRQYARELGLTMPLLVDPIGAISRSYGVIGLPTSFLIGRDGRAVARAIGPREWTTAEARALIESLLTEPTGRQ